MFPVSLFFIIGCFSISLTSGMEEGPFGEPIETTTSGRTNMCEQKVELPPDFQKDPLHNSKISVKSSASTNFSDFLPIEPEEEKSTEGGKKKSTKKTSKFSLEECSKLLAIIDRVGARNTPVYLDNLIRILKRFKESAPKIYYKFERIEPRLDDYEKDYHNFCKMFRLNSKDFLNFLYYLDTGNRLNPEIFNDFKNLVVGPVNKVAQEIRDEKEEQDDKKIQFHLFEGKKEARNYFEQLNKLYQSKQFVEYGKLIEHLNINYGNKNCEHIAPFIADLITEAQRYKSFDELPQHKQALWGKMVFFVCPEKKDPFGFGYTNKRPDIYDTLPVDVRKKFSQFIEKQNESFNVNLFSKDTHDFLKYRSINPKKSFLERFPGSSFLSILFNERFPTQYVVLSDKLIQVQEHKEPLETVLKGGYHELYLYEIIKGCLDYVGPLESHHSLNSELCIFLDGFSLLTEKPSIEFGDIFQELFNAQDNRVKREEILRKKLYPILEILFFLSDLEEKRFDPLQCLRDDRFKNLRALAQKNIPLYESVPYPLFLKEDGLNNTLKYNIKSVPLQVRHVFSTTIAYAKMLKVKGFSKITAKDSDLNK